MRRERPSCRQPLIRAWTQEDDAKLLELLRQGKQPVVIAVRLRRSTSAVYARKAKLEELTTAHGSMATS